MIFYKLLEGSHSYDFFDDSELANLFTKEDIEAWASDVASMIELSEERKIEIKDINGAIDILNEAEEFLEEVELIGGVIDYGQ